VFDLGAAEVDHFLRPLGAANERAADGFLGEHERGAGDGKGLGGDAGRQGLLAHITMRHQRADFKTDCSYECSM